MHPQVRAILKDLEEDRTHGASYLVRRAAAAFVFLAKKGETIENEEVLEVVEGIVAAQPSMAPMLHLGQWVMQRLEGAGDLRQALRHAVIGHGDWLAAELGRTLEHAGSLIQGCRTVATYSASSTVAGVIARSPNLRQILWLGPELGPPSTLAGLERSLDVIPRDRATGAEALLLGADAVTWEGLVSAGGTHRLAAEAREDGTPVYVAADESKLVPRRLGESLPLGRNEADQPLFDLTPLELCDRIVCGRGALTPDEVRRALEALPADSTIGDILRRKEEAG